MKVRKQTLWKVPVCCAVGSCISAVLSLSLGRFFFLVRTVGADTVQISVDPVRQAIFHTVLFLMILLLGGLWLRRSMTKAEIAVSAGITAGIYLLITLAQLCIPAFPISVSAALAYIQDWPGAVSLLLMLLTDNPAVSVILSSFAPLLFIPFGQKSGT